jgi:septum formation protein
MLVAAGLKISVMPADVDEAALKQASTADPDKLALDLAVAKAARISAIAPGALVIGADQLLVCNRTCFDKPKTLQEASTHLQTLRDQTHQLVTAACVVQNGQTLWSSIETPSLTMRDFSDTFLTTYLATEGEALCECVGAYRIEGPGMQLFTQIEGDYFTILGLPLLGLLAFLRQAGAIPA